MSEYKRKSSGLNRITNALLDVFFAIAIVICCGSLIFSVNSFISNMNNKTQITDSIVSFLGEELTQQDMHNGLNTIRESYVNRMFEYITKLQELEAKSVSTNILSFIYSFLSGTLIGVATYLIKKDATRIKEIEEATNTIKKTRIHVIKISRRSKQTINELKDAAEKTKKDTFLVTMHSKYLQTHFLLVAMRYSIDSCKSQQEKKVVISNNLPQINDAINDIDLCIKKGKREMCALQLEEVKYLRHMVNELMEVVNSLNTPENALAFKDFDIVTSNWNLNLNSIKEKICAVRNYTKKEMSN